MEIEAKYTVPDHETFERLAGLESLGDYTLRPQGVRDVADRYLDTSANDLRQAGWACRVRETDGGATWTLALKGLGGRRGAVHRRAEHETAVPAGSAPEAWPESSVRDLVRQCAAGRPLGTLFTLRQRRTLRDVWREDRHVALLSLDEVAMSGTASALTFELEIELAEAGGLDDLHLLGKLLRPFGLRAQQRSKFERALALVDAVSADTAPAAEDAGTADPASPESATPKKKRAGLRADDPMTEAGRKILRVHFDRMLAREAGTRDGSDIEDLHAMRVATRRQRAALRIVEPYFRSRAIRPIRSGLRALGQRLGAVRDLDVLLEAARAYQATQPAEEAQALQPLLDTWSRRREAARVTMLAHLDSTEYAAFKESYQALLDAPGSGVRPHRPGEVPRPAVVAHVIPGEVWLHYGAMRAFETGLRWASVPTLHALRIEGKRLRYLLEFFHDVLHPSVEQPIEAIVALQDHLGALHDADVAMTLVREFLAGPDAAAHPHTVAAAGRYLEACDLRRRELRHTVFRPWRTVRGRRFKLTLARAVAVL